MALLERIEKKTLKILQADRRIPNADLAAKAGMSKTACWNRMKRLTEQGFIHHIRAVLNPEKLGLSVLISTRAIT